MFIVDNILSLPGRGLLGAFRQIFHAAQNESADEADGIRTELRSLYMMLETDRVSSEEFDAREKELLDRLDVLQPQEQAAQAEGRFNLQPPEDGAREAGES